MPKKSRRDLLAVVFVLVSYMGLGSGFNASAINETSIEYRPLKKSGVKIPINEYERKDNKTIEFKISRDDISTKSYIWSWIWGKKFGFYMKGVNPRNDSKVCPYITDREKLPGSKIENLGDDKHQVTLVVPPPLIDAIIKNQCAVSPKPRKAPDPNASKDNKNSKKPNAKLFPTIYN